MADAAPSSKNKKWIPAVAIAVGFSLVVVWLLLVLRAPKQTAKPAPSAAEAPEAAPQAAPEPMQPAQPPPQPGQSRPAPRRVPADLPVPAVKPGDTCVIAQGIYGSFMERYDIGGGGWDLTDYSVSILPDQKQLRPPVERCIVESVLVTADKGRPIPAPEGLILGSSTLADVEKKFGARVIAESRCMLSAGTQWTASLSVMPDAQHPFRTQYSVGLTPETAAGFPKAPTFAYFEPKPLQQFELENPASPLETDGCFVAVPGPAVAKAH